MASPKAFEGDRGQRVYFASSAPPRFTTENYERVLFSEGIGRSFINSLTVTIPATIIPILIAAFAAYALAWMRFPGRALLIAVVIGLLVVPLQMSLIPLQNCTTASAPSSASAKPISASGWHTPASACPRHLSPLLYRRTAARDHESARIDGAAISRFCQDRAAAVVPSPPSRSSVPLGLERPHSGHGLHGPSSDQLVLTENSTPCRLRGGDQTDRRLRHHQPLLVFFSLQRYCARAAGRFGEGWVRVKSFGLNTPTPYPAPNETSGMAPPSPFLRGGGLAATSGSA